MHKKNKSGKNKFSILLVILISFNLIACSVATKRKEGSQTNLPIPATGDLPNRVDIPDQSGEGAEPPAIPDVKVPKIGIVLGPGGARSYAYIGVLREFEKAKIPIHTIAGLEWGALMGALYSVNGKAHDVEWKASKIPDDFSKKGLLSSEEPKPFSEVEPYLKTMFGDAKVETGKIPFSCITDNLKNFKSLMIFKGTYKDTLGYCLGQPPITTSKNGWVSSSLQAKYLIDQVAFRGVDYIILVDVVTSHYPLAGIKVDESTAILWSNINKSINENKKYVHQTIRIPISNNILDFKSRKEYIQLGERAGKEAAEKITQQFGL
ncbi:MAG: patatin-like phospholipase family protein [Bdellovibrionota bacterium]